MLQVDTATQNVMSLLNNGGAFDTSSVAVLTAARTQLAAATTSLSASGAAGIDSAVTSLTSVTATDGPLAQFGSHMMDQFANLPQRLGTYVNDLGLSQGTGQTPQFPPASEAFSGNTSTTIGDICTGVADFFGSIMAAGRALIDQISTLVGQIVGAIAALIEAVAAGVQAVIDAAVAAVQAVVNQIAAVANQMVDMVAQELQRLGDAIARLLNFTNALSLRGLFDHPCVRTVLGDVGTPNLISNLNVPRA